MIDKVGLLLLNGPPIAAVSIAASVPLPVLAQSGQMAPEPQAEEDQRPTPALQSLARGPRPVNVAEWARLIQMNYPAAALRDKIQGSVGVKVKVTQDGSVSSCQVTQTSEAAVLDQAACAGMIRYAQFDPALDQNGTPIIGFYTTRISYFPD